MALPLAENRRRRFSDIRTDDASTTYSVSPTTALLSTAIRRSLGEKRHPESGSDPLASDKGERGIVDQASEAYIHDFEELDGDCTAAEEYSNESGFEGIEKHDGDA